MLLIKVQLQNRTSRTITNPALSGPMPNQLPTHLNFGAFSGSSMMKEWLRSLRAVADKDNMN